MTAWVNPASLEDNYWDTILSSGASNSNENGYFLGFYDRQPLFGTSHAGGGDPPGGTPPSPLPDVTLNGWHHMAATFDGITKNLYLDGTLVMTAFINSPTL